MAGYGNRNFGRAKSMMWPFQPTHRGGEEAPPGSTVSLAEDLYHWKSDPCLPLSGENWEKTFVVLQGTSLRFYKSKLDIEFSAREELDIKGCAVDYEGTESKEYVVFSIKDAGGGTLVRLATRWDEPAALKWLCVLLAANTRPTAAALEAIASHTAYVGAEGEKCQPSTAEHSTLGGSNKHGLGRPTSRRKQVHKLGEGAQDDASNSNQADGSHEEGGNLERRAQDEENEEQERQKARARRHEPMSGSSPVHSLVRPSYLSSERMWYMKHTGLVNLMAVIVVATNFRLALENAFKYGLRIQTPLRLLNSLTIGNPNIPLALCYPCMIVLALLALFIEQCGVWSLTSDAQLKAAISKKKDGSEASYQQLTQQLSSRVLTFEWIIFVANIVNTSAAIIVPWAVIHYTQAEPLPGGVLIVIAIVLWMKLISYHHCNSDLRAARRDGQVRPGEEGFSGDSSLTNLKSSQRQLRYPKNITVSNLVYFLALPTLCYQINYPRSPTIRKLWLARRVAELVLMLTLLSLLLQQYMIPAISNSMSPMRTMDWPRLCERVLKLSLPNIYCWLVSFYCLFHLWLNILAEVLHFGDREFYKDWWNAATVGEYWKLWNMPVHKWLLRHAYFPTLRLGLPRWAAIMVVFFVSAILHELVLGVPLHLVRMWAFLGMMLQVPLVLITEYIHERLQRDEAGNIVFWLTFCIVGQPLSVLLYYHDYLYEVHPYLKGSSS